MRHSTTMSSSDCMSCLFALITQWQNRIQGVELSAKLSRNHSDYGHNIDTGRLLIGVDITGLSLTALQSALADFEPPSEVVQFFEQFWHCANFLYIAVDHGAFFLEQIPQTHELTLIANDSNHDCAVKFYLEFPVCLSIQTDQHDVSFGDEALWITGYKWQGMRQRRSDYYLVPGASLAQVWQMLPSLFEEWEVSRLLLKTVQTVTKDQENNPDFIDFVKVRTTDMAMAYDIKLYAFDLSLVNFLRQLLSNMSSDQIPSYWQFLVDHAPSEWMLGHLCFGQGRLENNPLPYITLYWQIPKDWLTRCISV